MSKESRPHRVLRVKANYMRGYDVEALQREINARLAVCDIDGRVKADGVYGPRTHAAAIRVLYYMGVPRSVCFMGPKPKRFTVRAQGYVWGLRGRTKRQRERGAKRVAAYHAGPDAALRWARSKVGITESPAGSNKGPQICAWQEKWLGWCGYFWCGAFAGYALDVAKVKGLVGKRIVYTPHIVIDAMAGQNGFRSWTSNVHNARKGDLVLFNWDGGVVDHVGIFTGRRYADGSIATIEGNTSSDNEGDQSNGGGVFARRRYPDVIEGFARPRWVKR